MGRVYLDHNATSPLDPRVLEAMLPFLGERHGNPSSVHAHGQAARAAVEEAREQVAELIGGAPEEIVFTASGTEANNTVLRQLTAASARRGLVISSLEHPSVTVTADELERSGVVAVTRIKPTPTGAVDAGEFCAAVDDSTGLACLMLANNELGTLQPVREVAEHCRQLGVPVLCDAVQAVGKVPVQVKELGIDYLTLAGHKFHGPLGAAALLIREGCELTPLLIGGGQERRRRASTENLPAIVGLGRACELARLELEERRQQLAALRDRLEAGLAQIPGVRIHGREAPRVPHTTHVAFLGAEGEALLIRLDLAGYAVSTGSACASGVVEPSPTLLAMGLSPEEALSSLRISFGTPNRAQEVDRFLATLAAEVGELRNLLAGSPEADEALSR